MIDEVVSIRAELEPRPFIDWKILVQGNIPVLEAWPIDGIAHAPLMIECADRWRGKDWRTIEICCSKILIGTSRACEVF